MSFDLNLAHMSISELLEKAAEKNELIYVWPKQKMIGKTSALIQYARENHCPVLMNKLNAINNQRLHPDIEFIQYEDGSELDGYENVVCDDDVPFDAVKRLHGLGHVLTGFISKEQFYNKLDAENKQKTKLQLLSISNNESDADSSSSKGLPLLLIELDEIDSVPRVFYKGEKITNRIAVDFEWRTRESDKIGSAYIRLKHGKEIDGVLAVDTKEIAFGERAYR